MPIQQQQTGVMVEWNVSVNGKHVGTVIANSEESVRCAACSDFDTPEEASISVSRR